MIGVVSIDEALRQAKDASLDLVEISPNAEPPVCKILDFSRYKYDAKKKLQEAKKKQKRVALKEMKFKINISQGDLDIKVKKIRGFLENGDKVKISLWFKGREIIHREKGDEIIARIVAAIQDVAKIDAEPKMEGKNIIMIISPGNAVI